MNPPTTPPAVERLQRLEAEGVPTEWAAVLLDALDALAHYRTRVHLPADAGYHQVATWVNDDALALTDQVLARTSRLRAWWRSW